MPVLGPYYVIDQLKCSIPRCQKVEERGQYGLRCMHACMRMVRPGPPRAAPTSVPGGAFSRCSVCAG